MEPEDRIPEGIGAPAAPVPPQPRRIGLPRALGEILAVYVPSFGLGVFTALVLLHDPDLGNNDQITGWLTALEEILQYVMQASVTIFGVAFFCLQRGVTLRMLFGKLTRPRGQAPSAGYPGYPAYPGYGYPGYGAPRPPQAYPQPQLQAYPPQPIAQPQAAPMQPLSPQPPAVAPEAQAAPAPSAEPSTFASPSGPGPQPATAYVAPQPPPAAPSAPAVPSWGSAAGPVPAWGAPRPPASAWPGHGPAYGFGGNAPLAYFPGVPRLPQERGRAWQFTRAYFVSMAGVLGFLISVVAYTQVTHQETGAPNQGTSPWLVLVGLIVALSAGFGEEMLITGLVTNALEKAGMTGKRVWVIYLVAICLRIPFHLYYGWAALGVIIFTVVNIWVYRRWRLLWPIVLAHATYDFVEYVGGIVPNEVGGLMILALGLGTLAMVITVISIETADGRARRRYLRFTEEQAQLQARSGLAAAPANG